MTIKSGINGFGRMMFKRFGFTPENVTLTVRKVLAR